MKQFFKDAIMAFLFWTICLSPYMVFIVGVDLYQYKTWVLMQAILVPPLGAIHSIIARRIGK